MRGMTGKHHSEKTKRLISKNSKRTGVSIKIINIKSEEIKLFDTLTECGKFFSVSVNAVKKWIKNRKIKKNDWQF